MKKILLLVLLSRVQPTFAMNETEMNKKIAQLSLNLIRSSATGNNALNQLKEKIKNPNYLDMETDTEQKLKKAHLMQPDGTIPPHVIVVLHRIKF
jgi:hypothetical protein